MKIDIKCFSQLAKKYDCDYRERGTIEIGEDSTVRNAVSTAGIPEEEVKIIFVNGKITGLTQALHSGDLLTLVPATGGM